MLMSKRRFLAALALLRRLYEGGTAAWPLKHGAQCQHVLQIQAFLGVLAMLATMSWIAPKGQRFLQPQAFWRNTKGERSHHGL